MLNNKIVLLNAPKGAGKDTIGVSLRELHGCEVRAFKDSLYEVAKPFTSCSGWTEFIYYCQDRILKEKPSELFMGMSPRNFLIYISEKIVKPHFGKEFFGNKAVASISEEDYNAGVVFTDSGFIEEAKPLVEKFARNSVFVVQFTGQGSNNFDGDSRTFINVSGATTIVMKRQNTNIAPKEFAQLITQEIAVYG